MMRFWYFQNAHKQSVLLSLFHETIMSSVRMLDGLAIVEHESGIKPHSEKQFYNLESFL